MDTGGKNGEFPIDPKHVEFPIDPKDGEFPIDPRDGEFSIDCCLKQDIQAPDDQESDKIYQELLHIVQGDHQEAGQEEEQPWAENAIWDEEQPQLQKEFFRNISAPRGLLMGQSDHQGVDGNNSATQTVTPKNFELGCSSVAQPRPSTTETVCPVNSELGSSNIAQPPSSTIPIKVLVGGGHGYKQHQCTVHVKPDEEVVVLRKLLKKLLKERRVTYLPQHYLFAFKRGVMNEDMSFRDHGIVSVQGTKIEVMDFTVHFPPYHPLREAGIASNRQLAVRQ